MAAGQLSKPGTQYGPCKTACRHIDCAETRATAEARCRLCGERIGYQTLFYREANGVVAHERCAALDAEAQMS
jgi:hypothetical protein